MNTRDFFVRRWRAEGPVVLKVLKALPEDQGDYRPHPRSRSASELAWLFANEAQACRGLIENGKVEWEDGTPPARLQQSADLYAESHAAVVSGLAGLDDAAWERPAQFLMGGQVAWEEPLGDMLWSMLFDAIHHRGQLSTYIRPMGGKVPSIYGPSGDDPGGG
jgi:uncharacterized damage-inducible protein DinB